MDNCAVATRAKWRLNEFVKLAKSFILYQRYRYVVDLQLLRPVAVGCLAAAVHGSRLCVAPIFKPYCLRGMASQIEQTEIFKCVRHERGHLYEPMIVAGGIVLELAKSHWQGLLLCDGGHTERKKKHCTNHQRANHS